jgi:glucosamine-6-phosphate deaminase
MTLHLADDHGAASARVTALVADAIRARPSLVLGLPTGRTPIALYAGLAAAGLDWSRVRTFNLDEFATVAPTHPGSFRAFMDAHLFRHVNLPAAGIGFLRGDTPDDAAECERYEAAIDAAGGIDLLLVGLGGNGHIGFNEPAESLTAATHPVHLHESTRRANAALFGGDWALVPDRALTMGMRQVLSARRVVLIATGTTKAAAVAAKLDGPLTTRCPASWLQTHPDLTVVVDRAAASARPGG